MRSHFLRAKSKRPQFVGSATAGELGNDNPTYTINVSSLTGGIASSPISGDLILIVNVVANTANIAMSTPSGFTEMVESYADDTNDTNLQLLRKISDGTETTVTLTASNGTGGSAAVAYVWRGVNQSSPIDVFDSATHITTGEGAKVNPPSITPVTAGAVVVGFGGTSGTGTSLTTPGSVTGFRSVRALATPTALCAMAAYESWDSGAYDMGEFGGGATTNTLSNVSGVLAIRPA